MKNLVMLVMLGITLVTVKAQAEIEWMKCQIVLTKYDPVEDEESNTVFPMVTKRVDSGGVFILEANGSAEGYDFRAQYYLDKVDPDLIVMKTTDQKTQVSQSTSVYAPHPEGTNWRIGIVNINRPDLSVLSEQCTLKVK